ncbi:hypothetical protein CF65_01474 [Aggregatibacter actinomycetemcomitans HK1651]|nr:hypothetical protein CF65_01474 [Aggregatibacter actinomycetemcomitans HK1651]
MFIGGQECPPYNKGRLKNISKSDRTFSSSLH